MNEKDQAQAAGASSESAVASEQTRLSSEPGIDKTTSMDTDTTNAGRIAANDDDEEEEGMLKVDEEGQIEEDDSKVSQARPKSEQRAIPLADRLMPLSDASYKKTGSSAAVAMNGHSSPRNISSDRERDRDRYHESSPGPSSSYAPQRSRFGYSAEAGSSYGAGSTYTYPPGHRDPIRPEPYASGSRTSFTGSTARTDNARGWYPASSTAPTPRGSDTYRPGANRDRERGRDREWDSFRDGDRDREWAGLDREREREGYRDMADKRRDWPSRERGALSSGYEAADSYTAHPTSVTSKYGYESRDYADRRPASPSTNIGRDRDFDSDRSRDRDRDRITERDPRTRAPTSGWGGAQMRSWGKPSDAPVHRPASIDARSDTSRRQSGSRADTTPPLGSSEAGTKPIGSDFASEKSEVRSRDMSPQTAQRTGSNPSSDTTNKVEQAHQGRAEDAVHLPSGVALPVSSEVVDTGAEEPQDKLETESASAAQNENPRDAIELPAADTATEELSKSTSGPSAPSAPSAKLAVVTPIPDRVDDVSGANSSPQNVAGKVHTEESTQLAALASTQTSAHTQQSADNHDSAGQQGDVRPQDREMEPASSPAAIPAGPSLADSSASGLELPVPALINARLPTASAGNEEHVDASAALPASATSTDGASNAAAQTASTPTTGVESGVTAEPAASTALDEPVQGEKEESTQVISTATKQSDGDAAPPATTIPAEVEPEKVTAAVGVDAANAKQTARSTPSEPISGAPSDSQDAQVTTSELSAPAPEALAPAHLDMSKQIDATTVDVDMPDVAFGQVQAQTAHAESKEILAAPAATEETDTRVEPQEALKASTIDEADSTQPRPTSRSAVGTTVEARSEADTAVAAAGPEDDIEMQSVDRASLEAIPTAPSASEVPVQSAKTAPAVDTMTLLPEESGPKAADFATTLPPPDVARMKAEDQPAPISDVSMTEATGEMVTTEGSAEQDSKHWAQTDDPVQAASAGATSVGEAAAAIAPFSEPQVDDAGASSPPTPSQIQVLGPHVTATIDTQAQTQEITLPHVDYGNDKEGQDLAQQEAARIEEVEMPAADEAEPSLRIAETDDADKDTESSLRSPSNQQQLDRAIDIALRQHITEDKVIKDDWKRIVKENQIMSQRTTMDVLKAKIHGIPLIVSSDQPLWLEDDDMKVERTKAQLFPQLLDRKKRLNEKIEGLKKRYRSINEEWKVHCSRLDRGAERREMLRRPPVNTPAGTPGVFGVEEPSPGGGGGGGGLLGASLSTGRANRRNAQAGGFASFGDAVRSEAEFLEILASLENADMQDPNMRAARTTATAPDMYIDPDSDQLTKHRYDDLNGFVADPLAFYFDEFDPDVWSEEEKAIFARRYALWPKQFGRIAQALPHKTPAQCVRYYYLNKKVPGNDFKALAAARNRERKRKARVKPKKAKGSALMADLKSAKGEEADDVEDGSGLRSPVESIDPFASSAEVNVSSNGRRGGRARMVPTTAENISDEVAVGRKRPADQGEGEAKGGDAKSEKRKSGPKSKRAKSDSASAAEKSRKSKNGPKKESATLDDDKVGALDGPSAASGGIKAEANGEVTSASAPLTADSTDIKTLEDSDLAAAEALAGLFGGPATGDITAMDALSSQMTGDLDADGRKVAKKRRSKTAVPGEEGAEVGGGKGRGKQPTSSYWSVAERYEFLRALATHGPRWEVVSSTLAQKSTAQARNYFARNEDEVDFAEAAALARSHAEAPLEDREAAALAFVRQRFASNSASAAPSLPSAAGGMAALQLTASGLGNEAGSTISGPTHLPPPPGISSFQGDAVDAKMRDQSPEPVAPRRGLQINSLLNDNNDAAVFRTARRSSLHDWQAERADLSHPAMSRDASVPPSLYDRQARDLDPRPITADRLSSGRPLSSDGRPMRGDHDGLERAYDRFDKHRSAADGRDPRDETADPRPWMYDSPYDAHRRTLPSSGYASMAPPSHPADRSVAASRYSMPPSGVSSSGHVSRSVPPMPSHVSSGDDVEPERERAGYDMYAASGRSREHESHSTPPVGPSELRRSGGEQISPTAANFGASHSYGRYPTSGVGSMYASTTAASAALASRSRAANGPLTAPLPSTSERPAYEQRWRGYSQSPGSTTVGTGGSHGPSPAPSAYSTGSAYRSSNSPYSSFPSQSLPRPSLPSLAASGGSAGAPHLPSLGAAGRSLPPILGTFPAPGRSAMGAASRSAGGTGEEARYWPYPHRPRGHEQGPSGRAPE